MRFRERLASSCGETWLPNVWLPPHQNTDTVSAALSSSRVEEGWPGTWRYLELVPEFQMVEVWWDEFHLYGLIWFGVPSRIFNNNTMVTQRKIKIIITFHSDHPPLVKLAKGRGSAVFEQTPLNQTIPAQAWPERYTCMLRALQYISSHCTCS